MNDTDNLTEILSNKIESTPYPVDYIELARQVHALFNEYCVTLELDEAMSLVIQALNIMEDE